MNNIIFKKELKKNLRNVLGRYELPNGILLQDLSFNDEDIFEDFLDYTIESVLDTIEKNSFTFSDELISGIKSLLCTSCSLPHGVWVSTNKRFEEIENVDLIKEGRKILPL